MDESGEYEAHGANEDDVMEAADEGIDEVPEEENVHEAQDGDVSEDAYDIDEDYGIGRDDFAYDG